MRDEAVISGIAHRGIEEAVDYQRAGFLVHLVFDRLAANRDFNDDIDVVRRILSDRDGVDTHGLAPLGEALTGVRAARAKARLDRQQKMEKPKPKRFRARWMPVRVKKTRQAKTSSVGPGESDLVERLGPELF